MVRGTSCGGKIGISNKMPKFDESFDVTLTGGPKSSAGLLHMGRSDSRFLFFRLPLHLSFFAKGCNLYHSTEVIMPVKFDAMGNAKVSQKIKKEWASWFREAHYQFSFRTKSGLKLSDYASVEKK